MSKKLTAALFAAVLIATLATPLTAGAEGAAVTVGTDDYGDWGGGGDNAAVGHLLVQDLVAASIEPAAADKTNFTIKTSFLPSPGGVPEASRYVWDMNLIHFDPATRTYADPVYLELDGKFTNYSRGACDPTAGKCPPPRDPGSAPFAVRGNCTTNEANVTTCQEVGLVNATFAAAAKTITIPVPNSYLNLAPCSAIAGAAGTFGGSVAAVPSAFVSSTGAPSDNMTVEQVFQVPSADGTACPAIPEF